MQLNHRGTRYRVLGSYRRFLSRGIRAEPTKEKEGNSFLPSTRHVPGLVLESLQMHLFYLIFMKTLLGRLVFHENKLKLRNVK